MKFNYGVLGAVLQILALCGGLTQAKAATAPSPSEGKPAPDWVTTRTNVGKIIEVQGQAWVTSTSAHEPKKIFKRPAVIHMVLHKNDVLETGPKSDLVIVLIHPKKLTRQAALLIKENSELRINHTRKAAWLVNLKAGMVLSRVQHQIKRGPVFHLKTGAAVLGVRGTTFFVKNIPKKDLFICPCLGTIELTSQGEKRVFTGRGHDVAQLLSKGPKPLEQRLTHVGQGEDHKTEEKVLLDQYIDSE